MAPSLHWSLATAQRQGSTARSTHAILRAVLESLLERLVATCTAAGVDLATAREAIHERSGPFDVGDAWYEERIRFFFDWYLCEHGALGRVIGSLEGEERALAIACTHAARGLYRCTLDEGVATLHDLIGGARFRVDAGARLRDGDLCDGYLVQSGTTIQLLPGAIFHPAEVHPPLIEIARRAHHEGLERTSTLDGLLRMKMRFDRFTNMRPQHIYRFEALDDRDILSAAWARPAKAGRG
jgi:hypothetical protein